MYWFSINWKAVDVMHDWTVVTLTVDINVQVIVVVL